MAVAVEQDGLVERVEALTAQLEGIEDRGARMLAEELAGSIVQLYGEGIERIFAVLARQGLSAAEARDLLVRDGVVASLMLIHGIYPVPLEDRVVEALDSVRPYMESHGGDVELVGVEEGVARLRLSGHCKGCAASASTLELAIEKALEEFAPDLLGLEVEGIVEPAQGHAPPGVALPMAQGLPMAGDPPRRRERLWVDVEGVATLPRGSFTAVNGTLLVANVAGTLLAYHGTCAGCGGTLATGVLDGGTLTCAGCERGFDLPRAGRCRNDEGLQLEPVPLLRKNGTVQVAVLA
jgi:Fe-S cluster biogenesis protein NfuA